jgi:hypothetical protein
MTWPRRTWTLIALPAAFLFIGAMMNVAVAWAALRIGPRFSGRVLYEETCPLDARSFAVSGEASRPWQCEWQVWWNRSVGFASPAAGWESRGGAETTTVQTEITIGRAGVPLRCLTDTVVVSPFSTGFSGEYIGGWRIEIGRTIVQVPTTPLWPGFLANTLFYGAMVWALSQILLILRRRSRRRRGRCVRCGYNRAGLAAAVVCPECGHLPP